MCRYTANDVSKYIVCIVVCRNRLPIWSRCRCGCRCWPVLCKKLAHNMEVITADPTGLVPRLLDPKGSLKTLLDDNNAIYNQVTAMIGSLAGITGELERLARFLTDSTPQISTILGRADNVLEGLSNNPLLRGGITEQKTQPPTFSTGRDGTFE